MHPIVRVIAGVVVGILASTAIVASVEALCVRMFPLAPGTELNDLESLRVAMRKTPLGALLMVLAGWFAGALAGTLLAARITRTSRYGFLVGVLLLAVAVSNLMTLPHPSWMWVATFLVYGIAVTLGTGLGAPREGVPSAAPVRS